MTEWIDNWLDNGWRRADGGPVKNRDDFMELYDLCGQINVVFVSQFLETLSISLDQSSLYEWACTLAYSEMKPADHLPFLVLLCNTP